MLAIVPSQTDPTKPILRQFIRDLVFETHRFGPVLKRAWYGDETAQSRVATAGALLWILFASVIGYPFVWLTAILSCAAIITWMSLLLKF
ncbi:MAG: hypothetical protein MRY63_07750 [Neomegalonema sp.]|nr:hypothetical protein [Neomegalonema sp.]